METAHLPALDAGLLRVRLSPGAPKQFSAVFVLGDNSPFQGEGLGSNPGRCSNFRADSQAVEGY